MPRWAVGVAMNQCGGTGVLKCLPGGVFVDVHIACALLPALGLLLLAVLAHLPRHRLALRQGLRQELFKIPRPKILISLSGVAKELGGNFRFLFRRG